MGQWPAPGADRDTDPPNRPYASIDACAFAPCKSASRFRVNRPRGHYATGPPSMIPPRSNRHANPNNELRVVLGLLLTALPPDCCGACAGGADRTGSSLIGGLSATGWICCWPCGCHCRVVVGSAACSPLA